MVCFPDVTQHLSDLNVKLQGKNQFVNETFEHICSFEKKQLFQAYLSGPVLTHFPSLAVRKAEMPDLNCFKYAESFGKLCAKFTSRFVDFRKF